MANLKHTTRIVQMQSSFKCGYLSIVQKYLPLPIRIAFTE